MMENGPDPKRPRLGPPTEAWSSTSANSPRNLPPPVHAASYPQNNSPFSRPDVPPPHYPLDRRLPPDHNQYEHHPQDPRRPSSGPPAHAPYQYQPPPILPPPPQPYTRPQDPMVKRDPSDDPTPPTAQSIYRPPSTSNGHDHNVNPIPHHEPPGRTYDPTRQTSFQQNSYPPTPSPMSAQEPYPPFSNNGLPATRDPAYSSVTYPAAQRAEQQNQIKRKAQRAAQACDSCRTLKAKCDEGRPACGSCKEKGAECRYRDPPPKQQDKQTADIIEVIMEMRTMMNSRFERLENEFKEFKASMQVNVAKRQSIEPILKQEMEESNHQTMPPYSRPSVGSETFHSADSPYSSNSSQHKTVGFAPLPTAQRDLGPPLPQVSGDKDDSSDEDNSGAVNPGPAGVSNIPINHTTGAARLLLITPIAELVADVKWLQKKKFGSLFPMVMESRRGCLRLFGYGEGHDSIPGYDNDPITDHMAENSPGDSPSSAPSPDVIHDEWGQIGGFTPPASVDFPHREFSRGEINAAGMPDLSRSTVSTLIHAYKMHFNNMHPLLAPRTLDTMVDRFLKSIPEGPSRPKQVPMQAGFVGGGNYMNPESPGAKRKRSPASGDYPDILSAPTEYKAGHPMRTMTTCLILLCMALGKISQHVGKIFEYETEMGEKEHESFMTNSPSYRNGVPQSPLQASSIMNTPNAMGSPQDMERNRSRSRRQSLENNSIPRSSSTRARNVDRIPGLAYFAIASDIIGNQLGGNTLQHVHAGILAGLYQAQIGRVMESHAYISTASRTLQILLRVKIDRFKTYKMERKIPPHKDNPLIFAFWTCLQLESDILAELPFPQTGVLTFEEDMPHPNIETACSIDQFEGRVIESYTAQLLLRKHLNSLHSTFYNPKNDLDPKIFFLSIAAHIANLESSIKIWAPDMQWDITKGEPATDILEARLRAKYYGAQVITYRHFILKILQGDKPLVGDAWEETRLPKIDADDATVKDYASRGIQALIHSTRAFHSIGPPWDKRLNVTNIWGTAHAQWGNMLVLLAAFKHADLHQVLISHISAEGIKELLCNTIKFLKFVASRTSALSADWRILEAVAYKLGFNLSISHDTNSSFGSSADTPMGGR